MWRDLPDEEKQEYINEYEIEKVKHCLLFSFIQQMHFIKS